MGKSERAAVNRKKKFYFVCCFCGKDIINKGKEILSVAVFMGKGDKDTEQTFSAHTRCFRGAIYDLSILREELGGPKLDFSKMKVLKDFRFLWEKKHGDGLPKKDR